MSTLYVQCTMRLGDRRDVAWIPEDCAVIDAVVSFGDVPEELWTITTVGDVKLPWSQVNERGRDWKNTRKASDV